MSQGLSYLYSWFEPTMHSFEKRNQEAGSSPRKPQGAASHPPLKQTSIHPPFLGTRYQLTPWLRPCPEALSRESALHASQNCLPLGIFTPSPLYLFFNLSPTINYFIADKGHLKASFRPRRTTPSRYHLRAPVATRGVG